MKITSIDIIDVANDFSSATSKWRPTVVRVNTDEGISGFGEVGLAYGVGASGGIGVAKDLSALLIGMNPMDTEAIWEKMLRKTFWGQGGGGIFSAAMSGLDIAMWDIKGKAFGVPVYEFLGGKARDRIKVYSWIGGDRPDDVAKAALERRAMGFDAVKMNATEELHYIDSFAKIQAVVDRVASIREACGNDFGIAVDFHGRVHKPMAKVLAHELEPYKLMFMEEVVLPENEEGFREVANQVSTPLATGERLVSRWQYKNLFREGAIDIIQPDVALVGGILETKKIVAMAEAFDMAAAPHAPYGPIALAATLQVDVCSPNVFIQEQSLGIHYNKGFDLLDFVKNKDIFQYKDGYVDVPTKPGLGLEIDEDLVKEVSAEGLHWTNPKWRNYDGTMAEW